MILSVFMISILTSTAYSVSMPIEKKDTNIVKVESKEKTVKHVITWNANGGKIGTKKTMTTSVNKGSKLNKLVTTPKRSGYEFKGWYTNKNGGKKITKNTVPTKNTIYYAIWKKNTNTGAKKLVGTWNMKNYSSIGSLAITYTFKKDGTYSESSRRASYSNSGRVTYTKYLEKGHWSTSGSTVYFTKRKYQTDYVTTWTSIKNKSEKLRFGSDDKGQYFLDNNNRKTYKA